MRAGLQRIVDDEALQPLGHRRDELVVDAFGDDQPRRGRAALAGREEGAVDGAFDGDARDRRRRARRAGSCRPSRAGTCACARREAAATRLPVPTEPVKVMASMSGLSSIAWPTTEPLPMTRLSTPFGRPARCRMSTIAQDAARHQVGRLEDDGVAVAERRRDLPGGNGDREIPRRDDADDADRLAGDLDADAGPHATARVSPASRSASPAKKSKIWRGAHGLADAFGQRLALLARQQPAELVLARQDLVGRPSAGSRGAPGCRSATMPERRPWPRRSRPSCVGLGRARIVADDVVGVGRIDVGDGIAADPFAVDQVLVQFAHVPTSRYGFALAPLGIARAISPAPRWTRERAAIMTRQSHHTTCIIFVC